MMRLKAKIERGMGQRIPKEQRNRRERELKRQRRKEKRLRRISNGGDENIEKSKENFPLLRRISIRRVSGLPKPAPVDLTRQKGKKRPVRLLYPLPTPLAGMMSEKLEA
jgi:hypothetical protein